MKTAEALLSTPSNIQRSKILSNSADERRIHYIAVAQSLGFSSDKEAFAAMGNEFLKLAKQQAPSINKEMKSAPSPTFWSI